MITTDPGPTKAIDAFSLLTSQNNLLEQGKVDMWIGSIMGL